MRAVNLIPSDDRSGAAISAGRSGGGIFVIAGLLAGLAIMALLYGLADHQISNNRAEVASLTVRAQQAQTRAGELSPYTSFLQMREQRVLAVTTLVNSRFDWAQAFQELGRVLPAGKVSLGSIEGTVGSTAAATPAAGSPSASSAASSSVTSATPPGSIPVFKLTGCASSQAEVALMLERLRLINGVNEVSLQSSTQTAASGAGSGSGGGCAGANPAFTAQITFDALPAIPTAGTGASASSVASSSSAATPSGTAATSAPASTTTTTSTTPAAGAASSSSAGAVR